MNVPDAPSNYWLLCIIYMCYLLNHIAYSKDPKIPPHRLTTDGKSVDHKLDFSEGSQPKTISKTP